MPQNWWEMFPEVQPSPAARQRPLPGPGGVLPGAGMAPQAHLPNAAIDPFQGPPSAFNPSYFAGRPDLDRTAVEAPLADSGGAPVIGRSAAIQQAAAAIRSGADPKAVRARLSQVGLGDPGFEPPDPFFDLMPVDRQVPGIMNPSEVAQHGMLAADQPPFGSNSLAGSTFAQMPVSRDAGNSKLPQVLVRPDGASPDRTGMFTRAQSGPDARFYPIAYTQDHRDTLPPYKLGGGLNGDGHSPGTPLSDAQMRQRADELAAEIRPVLDSFPHNVRAEPLPPDHPLPNRQNQGDDPIVVTGPRLADRRAMRQPDRSSTLSPDLEGLAEALSLGEGNYESYNTGTRGVPHGRVGHSYLTPPRGTVTGRTINEVLRTSSLPGTDTRRLFAVGRYQITRNTLRDAVSAMHLTGNERLTPELQDRIFAEYLVQRRAPLARFIFHGTGSVDDAQYAAAQEWASVAVPQNYRTRHGRLSDGGTTFYDGGPANRASSRATGAVRRYLMNLHR